MNLRLLATLFCFASISSHAATYTDRATFESAINVSYTETFQSFSGTGSIAGPVAMPTGLIVSSPSEDLFTVGVGQSSNPTEAIGSNYPPKDFLSFNLGGNYSAFGADLFQNFGGGDQSSFAVTYELSFFNGATLLSTINGLVAPNVGSFIGYTSDVGSFNRVQIFSLADSYEVADNVTVGTVTAVPEPETYAMLLAGLGLMGAVARSRKTKQTA